MKTSPFLILSVIALVLSSVLLTAASAKTLLDILAQSGPANQSSTDMFLFTEDRMDFNIMSNFLLLTGLSENPIEEEVDGLTIFAPNDAAFTQTAMDLGLPTSSKFEVYRGLFLFLSRGYKDPIKILQQMVLFHVLPGKMEVSVEESSSNETGLLDAVLYARGIIRTNMTLIDMNPNLPDPKIIPELSNKELSRSIVHVLDRMLFFKPVSKKEFVDASHGPLISPETLAEQAELDVSVEPSAEMLMSPEVFIEFEGSVEPSTELFVPVTPGVPSLLVTVSPGTSSVSKNPNQPSSPKPNVSPRYSSVISSSNSPSSEPASALMLGIQPENTYSPPDIIFPTSPGENIPIETTEEMDELSYVSAPESSSMPVPVDTNMHDVHTPQEYHMQVGTSDYGSDVASTYISNSELNGMSPTNEVQQTLGENGGDNSNIGPTRAPNPDTNVISTPEIYQTPGVTVEIDLESTNIAVSSQPPSIPLGDIGPFPEPSMMMSVTDTDNQETLTELEHSQDPVRSFYTEEPTMEPSGEGEDAACFPTSAFVHLSSGEDIPLLRLQAGHDVLVTESRSSVVYLFTHKRSVELHDFILIKSAGNHSIKLSQGHYIYANNKLKAAKKVKFGDVLRTLDGNTIVESVEWTKDYGLIAPHTLHGDIVVNRIVASTYTSALHPIIAHSVLWPLRFLVRLGIAKEPLGTLLYNGISSPFRSASSSEQTCSSGTK